MANPQRSEKRIKAQEIWTKSKGKVRLKALAEMLVTHIAVIRKWKMQDEWPSFVQNSKANAPKTKESSNTGNEEVNTTTGNEEVNTTTGEDSGNDMLAEAIAAVAEHAVAINTQKVPNHSRDNYERPVMRNARTKKPGGIGKQNNLKHGGFSAVIFDQLTDEEKEIVRAFEAEGKIIQVKQEITFCTIRERRVMSMIRKKMEGLTDTERKTLMERCIVGHRTVDAFDEETGYIVPEVQPIYELVATEIRETKLRAFDDILKAEVVLSSIQERKAKCLELLHKLEESAAPKTPDIDAYVNALNAVSGSIWDGFTPTSGSGKNAGQ